MAYTLAQLKTAIQNYTQNAEATFIASLDSFIRNTEDFMLYTLDLDIFRKNSISILTVGNRYLVKPNDYLASYGLTVNIPVLPARQELLMMKDVGYVEELNGTSGLPTAYAPYDLLNFIVGPTPDAAYAMELNYLYRPVSLVDGGGGATWLSTNASVPLLYGCLREAYIFMKGEPDLAAMYEKMFMESLSRAKDYAEARENTDANRVGLPSRPRT